MSVDSTPPVTPNDIKIGMKETINDVENQQQTAKDEQENVVFDDIDKIISMLNDKLQKLKEIFRGEAQFIVDRDINMVIIKIKDKDTGELIRQIPPEVAIKLAKNIEEFIGILFDELA